MRMCSTFKHLCNKSLAMLTHGCLDRCLSIQHFSKNYQAFSSAFLHICRGHTQRDALLKVCVPELALPETFGVVFNRAAFGWRIHWVVSRFPRCSRVQWENSSIKAYFYRCSLYNAFHLSKPYSLICCIQIRPGVICIAKGDCF